MHTQHIYVAEGTHVSLLWSLMVWCQGEEVATKGSLLGWRLPVHNMKKKEKLQNISTSFELHNLLVQCSPHKPCSGAHGLGGLELFLPPTQAPVWGLCGPPYGGEGGGRCWITFNLGVGSFGPPPTYPFCFKSLLRTIFAIQEMGIQKLQWKCAFGLLSL